MKIVFFGTSDFAVAALEALSLTSHKISMVVTAADKRKGRGQRVGFSPVKLFAQKKRLTLFQPRDLQDRKFLQALKTEGADLFVVAAYGKILTKQVLQIPRIYAINLHASLLPKYRGAAPVNWAIIKGEKLSGVTVFKMNEYMDRGEIILQEKVNISSDETSISLGAKLSKLAAQALPGAIELIEQGRASLSVQDETRATFAPKLEKKDGLIDWRKSAGEINSRIRGLQPWPGAFTYLDNKLLKIWQGQVVTGDKSKQAGQILRVDKQKGILVQTGRGQLLISMLQLEGKRKMSAAEFISGKKLETGKNLGRENG